MKVKLHLHLFFIVGLSVAVSCFAAEQESRVKAAFVYKFCDYVNWPQETFAKPDSPIIVGISGNKFQVSEIISAVTNRFIDNRPFEVRELEAGDSLEGIHVLYLSRNASASIDDFLAPDSTAPILTITDTEESSSLSIINFLVIDSRVRFEISHARAREVSLELSSQLLAVAHRVYENK